MDIILQPLRITQEDEQKRYNQIERKYSRRADYIYRRLSIRKGIVTMRDI
jgi:hypothetical protein